MSDTSVIDELRTAVSGQVVARDDDGFADAVSSHNPVAAHEPDVVVLAESAEDIAAAVGVAASHHLPVQVQNTGHGPSVRTRGGVLVRTGALQTIEIDAAGGTVRVGAGVVWGDLMKACAEQGVLPLGMASVATVGVVGYTVGGGMGPLAKQQGFAADHVVAYDVVDPTGTLGRVDAENQPDLFWALRGGRLGLGVITAVTLAVVPEPTLYTARLMYPRPLVAEALPAYAEWRAGLGANTGGLASLFRFPDIEQLPPPLRGQRFLQVDVIHLGDGVDDAKAAVARFAEAHPPAQRDEGEPTPAAWLAEQMSPPAGPGWQSSFVLDDFDADVATELLAAAGPETEAPWNVIELRVMGGAAAAAPATPNAVGRHPGLLVNLVVSGDPSTFDVLAGARDELKQRFGARAQDGTVVNFFGIATDYAALAPVWTTETFERLTAVRAQVDPDGRFSPPAV